jgi:hypothetical protein
VTETAVVDHPAGPDRNPLVEEILRLEFWDKSFHEAMATLASMPEFRNSGLPTPPSERSIAIQARRTALLATPKPELVRRLAELSEKVEAARKAAEADRQKSREQAAAEKERKQFYNQPDAQADFGYWLKHDFWSFDQSIALILGKNPNVVTWERVRAALDPPRLLLAPKPVPTPFLREYETLRALAFASQVMTASARLRPMDVVRWARDRLGLKLSPELEYLVRSTDPEQCSPSRSESKSEPSGSTSEAEISSQVDSNPLPVKRAALRALSGRWPTVEGDLRHSDRNGLAAVAKAPGHGMWREQDALEWARRNGRLKEPQPGIGIHDLPRRIFKSEG